MKNTYPLLKYKFLSKSGFWSFLLLGVILVISSCVSEEELKNANGVAGTGKEWHHIVSQRASNITKFGSNQIHNSKNLVKIEGGFSGSWHTRIISFYNSKSPMGIVNTGNKNLDNE